MEIDANGGVIEYELSGNGDPLVLMHGGEADMTMWRRVVPLLEDEFTVINYNQRDTGSSKHPDGPYAFTDLADDAAALINALGFDRAHIVGTSYGGMVAQEPALRHPERVDHLILAVTTPGFVLIDGVPLVAQHDEETANVIKGALAGDPDANRRLNELFFSLESIERDPGLPESLTEVRYQRPAELGERRMKAVYGFNSTGRWGATRLPVLVLAGASDRIVNPVEPWELAYEIPGATLVRLGGVGHVWALEAPERVVGLIKAFASDQL
jgi:pimeloyl-ACP methyl ester carboxylesterase